MPKKRRNHTLDLEDTKEPWVHPILAFVFGRCARCDGAVHGFIAAGTGVPGTQSLWLPVCLGCRSWLTTLPSAGAFNEAIHSLLDRLGARIDAWPAYAAQWAEGALDGSYA